jgi:hypothetical protein
MTSAPDPIPQVGAAVLDLEDPDAVRLDLLVSKVRATAGGCGSNPAE